MVVKRFSEIRKEMFEECGGKGAHLGEMTALGLNVPQGFVVLGNSFYQHLASNGIDGEIADLATTIDFEDYEDLETKTERIRALIEGAPVPAEIEGEVRAGYHALCAGQPDRFVAVRSSVAIRGSQVSSFPGLMDTFHYLKGDQTVIDYVRRCWGSVWSARAAFGRHAKGLEHTRAVIAPIVQLMVNSEVAGVAFTVNPLNGQRDEVVIESAWGLGEAVVSGRCLCDLFIAAKAPFAVKSSSVANKEQAYVQKEGGGAEWVPLPPEKRGQSTLDEDKIRQICDVACKVEEHYGCPQDLEWAFESDELFILQARKAKIAGER